jgi:hypothetical protein
MHMKRLFGIAVGVSQKDIELQAEYVVAAFLAAYGSDELSRAARQYTGA